MIGLRLGALHMKLHNIRLSNFQSFGTEPTELTLADITYLIGPNGSGKTALLQALCRLFAGSALGLPCSTR